MEAERFCKACPDATVIICGVGLAECASVVAETIVNNQGKEFVLAGIAGSYSLDNVKLGEVVEVVEESICALPPRFGVVYKNESHFGLRGVRSNSVNGSYEVKGSVDADIENMEGASFMAICQRFGVKNSQIRAISNRVGDPFASWKIDEALDNLTKTLESLY